MINVMSKIKRNESRERHNEIILESQNNLDSTAFRCVSFKNTSCTCLTIFWAPTIVFGHELLFAEYTCYAILADTFVAIFC